MNTESKLFNPTITQMKDVVPKQNENDALDIGALFKVKSQQKEPSILQNRFDSEKKKIT